MGHAQGFHDDLAGAISKTPRFVLGLPKNLPGMEKVLLPDPLYPGNILVQQRVACCHRYSMTLSQLEECEEFIEDEIGRQQWLSIGKHPLDSRSMVWITPDKIGKPGTCIDKDRH
jgi:hypothetical protein